MKVYKVQSVTIKKEVFQKMFCDLCKKETASHSWGDGMYHDNQVTIEHRWGTNYPDGGIGREIKIDLCPECFDNKLVPWLKSQGVCISESEWDW